MTAKRSVIVTGASRGIGRSTAILAGRSGYPVCVCYHQDETSAAEVVNVIRHDGGTAISHAADVSKETAVMALFEETESVLGPLGGLVNNAGISGGRIPFDEVSLEHFEFVLKTNLTGAFLCSREAVRRLSKRHGGQGGVIVNVTSVSARTGGNLLGPYVASKGGLNALTLSLAREFGKDGIRVNAVSPSVIATEQHPLDDEFWVERVKSRIPMKRIGRPEEVASVILWLMSDESSRVTGEMLDVTGGGY